MTDNLDETFPRQNIITDERRAKGDIEVVENAGGYAIAAHQPDNSIINVLCSISIADDGHVSATLTYLDWQAAYESSMGYKLNKLYQRLDGSRSVDDKSGKYLKLIRELGDVIQRQVEEAIYRHPVPLDRNAVYEVKERYLKALDRLGLAIRVVRKIYREDEENACAEPSPGLES